MSESAVKTQLVVFDFDWYVLQCSNDVKSPDAERLTLYKVSSGSRFRPMGARSPLDRTPEEDVEPQGKGAMD